MHANVISKPTFKLNVDIKTLDILIELSSIHYDYLCKMASKDGGFLINLKNALAENSSSSINIEATSCEINTILKICEIKSAREEYAKLLNDLVVNLSSAFDIYNIMIRDFNKTLFGDTQNVR